MKKYTYIIIAIVVLFFMYSSIRTKSGLIEASWIDEMTMFSPEIEAVSDRYVVMSDGYFNKVFIYDRINNQTSIYRVPAYGSYEAFIDDNDVIHLYLYREETLISIDDTTFTYEYNYARDEEQIVEDYGDIRVRKGVFREGILIVDGKSVTLTNNSFVYAIGKMIFAVYLSGDFIYAWITQFLEYYKKEELLSTVRLRKYSILIVSLFSILLYLNIYSFLVILGIVSILQVRISNRIKQSKDKNM